jgi:hypothetical protein
MRKYGLRIIADCVRSEYYSSRKELFGCSGGFLGIFCQFVVCGGFLLAKICIEIILEKSG